MAKALFFFFFLLLIALFVVFAPLFVSLLRRCLPFNCTYIYEHKRVHVPVIGPAFTAAQTLDKVPCCAPVETPAGKRGSSAVTPNFHMWGKGLKAGVWAWLGGCLFFFFFSWDFGRKGHTCTHTVSRRRSGATRACVQGQVSMPCGRRVWCFTSPTRQLRFVR